MNLTESNPATLQSIDDLCSALSEEDKSIYEEIIHSIQMPSLAFEKYCSWSHETYTRNCIVNTEKFELILLCWEAGQITSIHDHGGEECWVKVIDGELRETIYKANPVGALRKFHCSTIKSGDLSFMDDSLGYHSLENLSDKRTMSLHLYAKPIRVCNYFDTDLGKLVPKSLNYDTVI